MSNKFYCNRLENTYSYNDLGAQGRGHHTRLPGTEDGTRTLERVCPMNPRPRYCSPGSNLTPPGEEPFHHLKYLKFTHIGCFAKGPPRPSGNTQPSFLIALQTRNMGHSLHPSPSLSLVNHWEKRCYFLYFCQTFPSTCASAQALIPHPGHPHRADLQLPWMCRAVPTTAALQYTVLVTALHPEPWISAMEGPQDLAPVLWLSSLIGQCPVVI